MSDESEVGAAPREEIQGAPPAVSRAELRERVDPASSSYAQFILDLLEAKGQGQVFCQ